MTAQLIIARHGNTFAPNETPRRVGARTDLPLVKSGRKQACQLGAYLKKEDLRPQKVFTSTLVRTRETAKLALQEAGWSDVAIESDHLFDEIDYGPDENKPEDVVRARLGEDALKRWDELAIVPDGWQVSPDSLIEDWHRFAKSLIEPGERTLVVTSNGVARFAPHLTGNFERFRCDYKLKLSTGALGILDYDPASGVWEAQAWNLKPRHMSY